MSRRRPDPAAGTRPLRICLVYDCLFPHTIGGAERWYRNLAERLVAEGHEVTYLTLRQWDRGADPGVAGVDVRAVGPRMRLYAGPGRRRILPPLVFGIGVLLHLLRHGRRYDVVHTASFPYFSLLAAAAVRKGGRGSYRLIVDWHEVWSPEYWKRYLGAAGGRVGWLVQRVCTRMRQEAFCFSGLHASRLREEGLRGRVTILRGEYGGSLVGAPVVAPQPLVVFAGRLIPEKRVELGLAAVAQAVSKIPGLRAVFYGDGPDRAKLVRAIRDRGLAGVVEAPGFAPSAQVETDMRQALCLLLPSEREGYGLVVVEAAANSTPSVVVAGPDNAASELIEDGVNGFVVAEADPTEIAEAIVTIHRGGLGMRRRTARWFSDHAQELSLERSLEVVIASYAGVDHEPTPDKAAALARAA